MTILGRTALALVSLVIALTPCHALQEEPVRIGVAGLTHGHVNWILRGEPRDVQVVGIYEPNRQLAEKNSSRFGFSM